MAYRQTYTPNVKIGATRGWCLKYIDDAGNAPARTANADIAYTNERNAKRIRTTTPPVGVWVVGYMSLVGQPGHVFFILNKGNGVYEIRDSETQSGARSVYTSIASVLAWYSNYAPVYRGWSTHCDGRQYAEVYQPSGVKDTLLQGEIMRPGQYLKSKNGVYRAVYQLDGNFVVYKISKALWHARTWGKKSDRLILQGDGNLVIYNVSKAVWNTKTNGSGGYKLVMQDDGNLVLYTKANKAVWHTHTYGK